MTTDLTVKALSRRYQSLDELWKEFITNQRKDFDDFQRNSKLFADVLANLGSIETKFDWSSRISPHSLTINATSNLSVSLEDLMEPVYTINALLNKDNKFTIGKDRTGTIGWSVIHNNFSYASIYYRVNLEQIRGITYNTRETYHSYTITEYIPQFSAPLPHNVTT